MFSGKKVLLGITGSIAAYKSITLIRLLVKAGAEVKVVLSPAAVSFVSPLVLSTLSKNKVIINLAEEDTWANHVMLGRWADVMVIAPLTCNTLAKMANGYCDNILLAVYLSATCPIIVAPAMDEDMWHHPSVKKNIQTISEFGNKIIPVATGELASGIFGEGRMAEPEEIMLYLQAFFFRKNTLQNKKVIITAGPTQEALDPVRFVSNHSSGKMGFALADAFYLQGADVTLISGPVQLKPTFPGIKFIGVHSAAEMYNASINAFIDADIAVLSAAVADYKPANIAIEKIKKSNDVVTIELNKTKDILKSLGEVKKQNQFLVGFALETNNEKENAIKKLTTKNADLIVLNSLRNEQTGFGFDTNHVHIFDKEGNEFDSGLHSKKEIAEYIVNIILKKLHE